MSVSFHVDSVIPFREVFHAEHAICIGIAMSHRLKRIVAFQGHFGVGQMRAIAIIGELIGDINR